MATMFEERSYRNRLNVRDLETCQISLGESDLWIRSSRCVKRMALGYLAEARAQLEKYIKQDPQFVTALKPHRALDSAPLIVQRMCRAADAWEVGPMAAVAGAVSEYVGEQLALSVDDVIVENGGDIFVKSERAIIYELYVGSASPFANKLRFRTTFDFDSLGVCTSSATVGHSRSFGKADAVCVLARDVAYCDAAATALCNQVQGAADVQSVLEAACNRTEIKGLLIVCGDQFGALGAVEIV